MVKALDFAGKIKGKDGESAGFCWGNRGKRSDGPIKTLNSVNEIERKDDRMDR